MFDNNFGKCGPIFKILYHLTRKKILYVYTTKISISLAIVATLFCESQKSKKMLPNFHVERDNNY